MADRSGRLDSWKEIARHLGRDVSTVMRWERERALPVYRLPGAKRSGVFAHRDELDGWLLQHPSLPVQPTVADTTEPTPDTGSALPHGDQLDRSGRNRLRPIWIATAAVLLTGLVFAATLASNAWRRPVAELVIEGNELRAHDTDGRVVWVHRFDVVGLEAGSGRWVHIGDLDADDEIDIVAVVKTQRTPGGEVIDQILRFSENGELRWARTPDMRVEFRNGEYGPPWASEDLIAFDAGGERRLAWAVRHYTWWPSMVLVLDGDGRERGRFVNSGWIRTLAVSQDGRRLMASGIVNAYHATFLALFDPNQIRGSSPEAPDSEYVCKDCGDGGPLEYFVFPRTDVSEHAPFPPFYAPVIQTFADGALQVRVSENGERYPPEMIYEFPPAGTLAQARLSDRFWEWHRHLQAEGRLHHDQRNCPMRGSLGVRHWTPAEGWRTLRIPSV